MGHTMTIEDGSYGQLGFEVEIDNEQWGHMIKNSLTDEGGYFQQEGEYEGDYAPEVGDPIPFSAQEGPEEAIRKILGSLPPKSGFDNSGEEDEDDEDY